MQQGDLLDSQKLSFIVAIPSVEVFTKTISHEFFTEVTGHSIQDRLLLLLKHMKKFCSCGGKIGPDRDHPNRRLITLTGSQSKNVADFFVQHFIDIDRIKFYVGSQPESSMIYIDLDIVIVIEGRRRKTFTKVEGLYNHFRKTGAEKTMEKVLQGIQRKFNSESKMIGPALFVEGDCRGELYRLLIGQGDAETDLYKLLHKMSLNGFVSPEKIKIFGFPILVV